jgi:large subunit ribosomal protein L22
MAVTIKLRYLRHSARKLTPYTRLFFGKNLEQAIAQTSVMVADSAKYINKGLLMAKSAAIAKEFDTDNMVISEIFATIGPKVKRSRANSRGRSNAYLKHLAHLQISIDNAPAIVEKPARKVVKKAVKTEQPVIKESK